MIVGLCSVILWFVIFPKGLCKQRLTNHINDNSIQYFEQFTNITIPIMIHFDKELTLKLRKSSPHRTRYAMKTISKNVLKKVERLFLQPSLNQRIKLELIDARSLKRRLVNDTNISVYLKRYCTWQGERKNLRKMNYFSVLLTGLDMYHLNRMRKNWKATGRTYKGGVCSTYFSCTLLEWKPRNIVYLLAHEIAHSLGVAHDDDARCLDKRHIMTRQYNPHRRPNTWSVCSRLATLKFLTSQASQCLKNVF